jgi:hypothetical protein
LNACRNRERVTRFFHTITETCGNHQLAFLSRQGPHKRGNGIDQGLEHFRQDGLGRTLLAGFCEQWIGPPGRSVANSQAMTNTKSFRLERYAGRLPPSWLIAGAMDRAMMDPTEGHGESIARLMAEMSDSRLICKLS